MVFAVVADKNANMLFVGDEASNARYPVDDLYVCFSGNLLSAFGFTD